MPDDYSAQGGIEAIVQAGLRIPVDLSITGYDGIRLIQRIHPKLTTIRQDGEGIGRQAARRLIRRIEDPERPVDPPDILPGELLPGETVAPPGA